MAGVGNHELRDACDMDEKAMRRAALITVRRAICERFPPGQERDSWLAWLGRIEANRAQSAPRWRGVPANPH